MGPQVLMGPQVSREGTCRVSWGLDLRNVKENEILRVPAALSLFDHSAASFYPIFSLLQLYSTYDFRETSSMCHWCFCCVQRSMGVWWSIMHDAATHMIFNKPPSNKMPLKGSSISHSIKTLLNDIEDHTRSIYLFLNVRTLGQWVVFSYVNLCNFINIVDSVRKRVL